jgi:hypothetical protein
MSIVLISKPAKPNGFGLMELVIAVGVFSFVVMAVASLNLQLISRQSQSSLPVQLDIYRRNIASLVLDPGSWDMTIRGAKNSPGMLCLVNATPCTTDGSVNGTPIQNQPFALYDRANTLIYDATNPRTGITLKATTCNLVLTGSGFSSDGNEECPLRYNLVWSAICVVGNCVNPQIRVSAKLVTGAPTKSISFNLDNYSVPDITR